MNGRDKENTELSNVEDFHILPFIIITVLKERIAEVVTKRALAISTLSFESRPSSYLMAPTSSIFPHCSDKLRERKVLDKLILKYNLRHDLPWRKAELHSEMNN